jgi:hypothetical protein
MILGRAFVFHIQYKSRPRHANLFLLDTAMEQMVLFIQFQIFIKAGYIYTEHMIHHKG